MSSPEVFSGISLQLLLQEDGSLQVTDGKSRVHLNYGDNGQTRTFLENQLAEIGQDVESLNLSMIQLGDFSISCHLKEPPKNAEFSSTAQNQELIISLDVETMDNIKLLSSGTENDKPSGTFYLALELGVSRKESLKRELKSRDETLKTVSKISGIEMDELMGSFSKTGVGETENNANATLQAENEGNKEGDIEDETGGINMLGIDWNELPEVEQPVVIPDPEDKFWLRFDDVSTANQSAFEKGIVCESFEDFVKQSSFFLISV